MDAVLHIQPECSLNKFLKNVDEMGMYYQKSLCAHMDFLTPYKVMLPPDRRKKLENQLLTYMSI